jgi:hypothetical protein
MGKKRLTLTRELADEILGYLADGSAPFISIAAERAGVPRATGKAWLSDENMDYHEVLEYFRLHARKTRGTYMANLSREIQAATKENAEAARQKAWILTCLDQETFNLKRSEKTPKEAPDRRPSAQSAPPAADSPEVKEAENDLATPELATAPKVH